MFNKNIKLVLAVLLVAFGIYTIVDHETGTGIFYILLSAIPIVLYFKNEFIILAFLQLRKQNFPGAQKWLAKIKHPETALIRKQQGYFYYLHGMMTTQKDLFEAEKHFKKAVSLGLNMDLDLAVAKLGIAQAAMARRRKIEATNLINEANKLDKHNMLKDQIKMLKEHLKKM